MSVETLETVAKIIIALTIIGSAVVGGVKWYLKQKKLEKDFEIQTQKSEKEIKELRTEHVKDIKKKENEMCA